MAIRFLQSPTGTHRLSYMIGDVASLDTKLENELIEKGIAEKANEAPKEATKVSAGGLQSNDTKPRKGKGKS